MVNKTSRGPSATRVQISVVLLGLLLTSRATAAIVLPGLAPNLVCYYDFDHPVAGNAAQETDRGLSGTPLNLINGGSAMRTNDGAHAASFSSLQTGR